MKIRYFAAAFLLAAGVAAGLQAKVTNIADWENAMPARNNDPKPVVTCAESCAGYDLTTLICPEGKILESCKVPGCHYYHRCVVDNGQ